jgi:hypothetical protein
MTDNKMLTCTLEQTAGAVYSLGDTIVFEVLKHNDDQYMRVIVQAEDVMYYTYIFKYHETPTEVMQIFDYVRSKSFIRNNMMLGPHILRSSDNTHAISRLRVMPGETTRLNTQEAAEYHHKMFARLLSDMRRMKQL